MLIGSSRPRRKPAAAPHALRPCPPGRRPGPSGGTESSLRRVPPGPRPGFPAGNLWNTRQRQPWQGRDRRWARGEALTPLAAGGRSLPHGLAPRPARGRIHGAGGPPSCRRSQGCCRSAPAADTRPQTGAAWAVSANPWEATDRRPGWLNLARAERQGSDAALFARRPGRHALVPCPANLLMHCRTSPCPAAQPPLKCQKRWHLRGSYELAGRHPEVAAAS